MEIHNEMEFKKTSVKLNGTYFKQSNGGKTLLLRPVDREYPKGKKAPVYFASLIEGTSTQYLSGLFHTKDPSIFSLDYKDRLNIKHMLEMQFDETGEAVVLRPKAKKKRLV